jgi:hypothetical protein
MSDKAKEREEKIRLHCSVLAEVILAIRPVYLRAAKPQQALLETMIGAAIWYIPKPVDAWTGKISKKALAEFHPDSGTKKVRLSEEHVYPRKIAAKRLIQNNDLTAKGMESIFREEYGRLHYITPEENKTAIRFQKSDVFTTPEEVYRQAGIELVSVERTDLRAIKKRDRDTIEKYTKREAIKSVVSIPLRAPRFTS